MTTGMQKNQEQGSRCSTCGRLRGLALKRESWGLQCPTVLVPRTGDPNDRPAQITNDLIYNAGVWRNGGTGSDTHLCDDCLRIGLRAIKLKVDALLESIEEGADKDAEIADLTQRLGKLQFHYQSLVHTHNRMQSRMKALLALVKEPVGEKAEETIRFCNFEVNRGPEELSW